MLINAKVLLLGSKLPRIKIRWGIQSKMLKMICAGSSTFPSSVVKTFICTKWNWLVILMSQVFYAHPNQHNCLFVCELRFFQDHIFNFEVALQCSLCFFFYFCYSKMLLNWTEGLISRQIFIHFGMNAISNATSNIQLR